MTSADFLKWVLDMFKEIVRVVFPGATAVWLIMFGIRLSWKILQGKGLK